MTRTDSTQIKWRVQTRASNLHIWRDRGLWETRSAARANAAMWREGDGGYGFGNTRVIRHVAAVKGKK